MKLEVWKFGGASLADGRAIQKAAQQIAAHRGPLVVVASALAGVTDLLLQGTPEAGLAFQRKHVQAARAVLGSGAAQRTLARIIDGFVREYHDLCAAATVLGYVDPRLQDLLVSRGERISAQLLAAALTLLKRRARYVDALEVVSTDDVHGGATPVLDETRARARRVIRPLLASNGDRRRPRLHRPRGGWQPDHARARRLRPDGHAAGALACRTQGGAVERRGRHSHRRPPSRARRTADSSTPPPRGRGSRALWRQGPASTRADSHRRHHGRVARAVVPSIPSCREPKSRHARPSRATR